jgi:hypothetical protein
MLIALGVAPSAHAAGREITIAITATVEFVDDPGNLLGVPSRAVMSLKASIAITPASRTQTRRLS